jgi:hypothetical protein
MHDIGSLRDALKKLSPSYDRRQSDSMTLDGMMMKLAIPPM